MLVKFCQWRSYSVYSTSPIYCYPVLHICIMVCTHLSIHLCSLCLLLSIEKNSNLVEVWSIRNKKSKPQGQRVISQDQLICVQWQCPSVCAVMLIKWEQNDTKLGFCTQVVYSKCKLQLANSQYYLKVSGQDHHLFMKTFLTLQIIWRVWNVLLFHPTRGYCVPVHGTNLQFYGKLR